MKKILYITILLLFTTIAVSQPPTPGEGTGDQENPPVPGEYTEEQADQEKAPTAETNQSNTKESNQSESDEEGEITKSTDQNTGFISSMFEAIAGIF